MVCFWYAHRCGEKIFSVLLTLTVSIVSAVSASNTENIFFTSDLCEAILITIQYGNYKNQ